MSGAMLSGQSGWEETHEEFQRRCEMAKSNKAGWAGTILGVISGIAALLVLFVS